MADMDKEKSLLRKRLENLAWLLGGLLLAAGIIMAYRGGTDWFGNAAWDKVTGLEWFVIAVLVSLALLLQYGLIHLLRFTLFKHVLWLLPATWLFINGLLVIQRLMESEQGLAASGFVPLTDLVGWVLSAAYLPLLAAGGAVAAIVDSHSLIPSNACHYGNAVADVFGVSNRDLMDWAHEYFDVLWDLVSESFVRQVAPEYAGQRPFIDFSQDGLLALPHWFFNFGYTFSCITV